MCLPYTHVIMQCAYGTHPCFVPLLWKVDAVEKLPIPSTTLTSERCSIVLTSKNVVRLVLKRKQRTATYSPKRGLCAKLTSQQVLKVDQQNRAWDTNSCLTNVWV